MYIVTSKPKRTSLYSGVSHFMFEDLLLKITEIDLDLRDVRVCLIGEQIVCQNGDAS